MESDDLLSLAEDSDDLTAVVRAVNRADTVEEVAEDSHPRPRPTTSRPTRPPTRCPMRRSRPSSRPNKSLTPPRTRRPVDSGPREPETEPTPERKRRAGRRASVPSWDEIMLGKRKDG